MARIRSIKPEFWTSSQVMKCPALTRLFFIGLWNFCDDYGRSPADPMQLSAQIFPRDRIEDAEVGAMLEELAAVGLIRFYTVDGRRYLEVTGWAKHQRVDKPQKSKLPPPPGEARPPGDLFAAPAAEPDHSTEQICDHSTNIPGMVDEHSAPESSRVEGKGEEGGGETRARTRASPEPDHSTEQICDHSTNVRRMVDEHSAPESSRVERKGEEGGGETRARTRASPEEAQKLEAECRKKVEGLPVSVNLNFAPILRLLDEGLTRDDVLAGIDRAIETVVGPRSWSLFDGFARRAAKDRIERALRPTLRILPGGGQRAGPSGGPGFATQTGVQGKPREDDGRRDRPTVHDVARRFADSAARGEIDFGKAPRNPFLLYGDGGS